MAEGGLRGKPARPPQYAGASKWSRSVDPFNRADIAAGKAHACGELVLGKSALLPEGANRVAQEL